MAFQGQRTIEAADEGEPITIGIPVPNNEGYAVIDPRQVPNLGVPDEDMLPSRIDPGSWVPPEPVTAAEWTEAEGRLARAVEGWGDARWAWDREHYLVVMEALMPWVEGMDTSGVHPYDLMAIRRFVEGAEEWWPAGMASANARNLADTVRDQVTGLPPDLPPEFVVVVLSAVSMDSADQRSVEGSSRRVA